MTELSVLPYFNHKRGDSRLHGVPFSSSLFQLERFWHLTVKCNFQFFLISTSNSASLTSTVHSFQFFLISTWKRIRIVIIIRLSVLPYFNITLSISYPFFNTFSSSLFQHIRTLSSSSVDGFQFFLISTSFCCCWREAKRLSVLPYFNMRYHHLVIRG